MLRDVLLRPALLPDLPALIDVQQAGAVQALAHIFPQDRYPFPRVQVASRWAAEIAAPDVAAYVIEHEGRIAGFAALRDNELLHFGTAVETWSSGFADGAHRLVVERLVAAGSLSARLRVFEQNHRARRFYEKRGWRRTDRINRTSFPPHPVLVEYHLDLLAAAG